MPKIRRKKAVITHQNVKKHIPDLSTSSKQMMNITKTKKNSKRKIFLNESISNKKTKSEVAFKHNHDSIKILWLDIKNSDYLDRKGDLYSIRNYLKVFDNVDSYIDYLLSLEIINNSKQKLFLVMSGTQSRKILPLIYQQLQIIYIYIFCANKENHEEWTKIYSNKIKGIFIDKNELISQLNDDILFYSKMTPISIVPSLTIDDRETSSRNLNKEQTSFMWYQLLMEILKRMPLTMISRNDLLKECQIEYSDNKIELHKIQEFIDTYHSDNVIEWYTRDSFLYRLLNKALRTQDILIIYKFRFVLVDLHNRLSQLHTEYIQSLKIENESISELIVFRGQGLTITELQKLKDNIHGRIAMNSFLSTSTSSSIALSFAGDGTGRPSIESVFFEIHCPIKIYQTKPFANIQKYSYTKTENEILFTIGTIFQIDFIEELTDYIWYVKLTLSDDENDLDRNELIDNLKTDILDTTEISSLAKILIEINEFDKAKHFYNLILKDLSLNHCDRINVKNSIGLIHSANGDYLNACKCYKQALKINRRIMPNDLLTLSIILNNIGHAYNELGNYLQSIKYHRKALRIQKKILTKNDLECATTFNHLGVVYGCLSKYKLALKYLEKAKEIRLKFLPSMHPHLGETFNNIGEIYLSNGHLNEARINLEKALEIQLKSLPTDHPILSASYSNLGCAYDRIGNFQKAIEYHKKSLDICLKSISKDHPDLATTYNNMAECYNELDDFTSASFYHTKALKIRLKSLPYGHPDIITSYKNIGSLYIDEKNHKLALKYLKKAISQSSSNTNKELLANIYSNFGALYENKLNIGMAIKYYKKAINTELECDEFDKSPSLSMTYGVLGVIYLEKDNLKNALINLKKGLEIGENCLEFNDNPIQLILSNLVEVYISKEDYTNALDYIHKYLDIQLKNSTISSDDLATTYFKIGYINDCKQDYKIAKINYQKALEYISSDHSNQHIGQIYYYLAFINNYDNDYDTALENYENALKYFSKDDSHLPSIYNNIGHIYRSKRNYIQSLNYYNKALEISAYDKSLIRTLYFNIAVVYDDKHNFDLALEYYKMALDTVVENEEKDVDLLIKIYNNIARIHMERFNYDEGINYCQKVLKLELNSDMIMEDHDAIATTYNNLATVYFHKCDYQLALENYEKALEIASKSLLIDHPHIVEYRDHIATTKRHIQHLERKNV